MLQTPSVAAGSGTSTFNFSGGTLQNAPAGNLSVALPVNLSGQATVVVDNGQRARLARRPPIGGSGSLFLSGGGTLTLSGTNTYAGGTDVLGGELIVTSPQGIEDGSSLYVGAAGSIFAPVVPDSPVSAPAADVAVPEPGTWALLAAGIACVASPDWENTFAVDKTALAAALLLCAEQ